MGKIHYPPEGYTFNQAGYGAIEFDDEGRRQPAQPKPFQTEVASKIRALYPELSGWGDVNLFMAWGEHGEAINGLSDWVIPKQRDEDFIAYLYAEQELKDLMVRDDGVRFSRYDLDDLDDYWRKL